MPTGPEGEKRPRDPIANAVHCCKVLVGDAKEDYADKRREGGLKGGRARAAKLSPQRRSEIARKAAAARWEGNRARQG